MVDWNRLGCSAAAGRQGLIGFAGVRAGSLALGLGLRPTCRYRYSLGQTGDEGASGVSRVCGRLKGAAEDDRQALHLSCCCQLQVWH